MKLTRRSFIQYSAATACLLAAGCSTTASRPVSAAMIPRRANGSSAPKGEWIGSVCQGCTQWCAIQIFVQDGRAVRVRGNPASHTNHGYCCPRGHLIPQQVYDPDRVKVPMKRTNPVKGRGVDPKFVPITWDEAMDTVAEKMMELRRAREGHKFMYMRGRYSSTSTDLLYGTLPKVYGTGNYFSHSAICAEAEKMGPGLTQGFFGYRDYDLAKTNCLVLWGADPLASNRMVPNTIHYFHEIMARGTIVAVDPRLSNVAAKAHEWLPIKPGTDGALAGAIAHVLLTEANAVSDNPLVFTDTGEVISGGNFHAEPVAFAADQLTMAVSEIGALSERRIALLIDATISGLPAFLVANPGVNSGFMIAHVTAAALASENKTLSHPASVDSLPTSANQEDHVSMATFAARKSREVADNVRRIVAIELLAACQGIEFRRPLASSQALEAVHAQVRSEVPRYDEDRYLAPEMQAMEALIERGGLRAFLDWPLQDLRA